MLIKHYFNEKQQKYLVKYLRNNEIFLKYLMKNNKNISIFSKAKAIYIYFFNLFFIFYFFFYL